MTCPPLLTAPAALTQAWFSCASACAHSWAAARAVSRHGVQGVGVRLKFILPLKINFFLITWLYLCMK